MTFLKDFKAFPSGQAGPGEVSRVISDQSQVGKSPMKAVEAQPTGEEDAQDAIPDGGSFASPRQSSISKDGIREPWQFSLWAPSHSMTGVDADWPSTETVRWRRALRRKRVRVESNQNW